MLLGAELLVAQNAYGASQDKRFEKFEIRVIRPKYFSKRGKLELGAQGSVITNQTFIYTFMASGLMTYHFSESMGIELSAAYGFSIDKDDKTLLKDTFDINTIILRTQYTANAALLITPIYGKFQTDEGSLIYFDTFISLGGGMTGIDYQYDHCPDPADSPSGATPVAEPPSPTTATYPTFLGGIGQRFFLNKKTSFRWDIRGSLFTANNADGSCDQDFPDEGTKSHQNVTIQIGTSKFF